MHESIHAFALLGLERKVALCVSREAQTQTVNEGNEVSHLVFGLGPVPG